MADPVFTLTPNQRAQAWVMRAIASALVDTPLVLKGGALIFAYGLDRYSADLDFDSTKKLNLEGRIHSALAPDVKVFALKRTKDTDTMTRYRLTCRGPESSLQKLKIEISYREAGVAAGSVLVNGVRTYEPGRLAEQKLAAAFGRTALRDLYDLAFLATRHPQAFGEAAACQLGELTADVSALEARHRPAFEREAALPPLTARQFGGGPGAAPGWLRGGEPRTAWGGRKPSLVKSRAWPPRTTKLAGRTHTAAVGPHKFP